MNFMLFKEFTWKLYFLCILILRRTLLIKICLSLETMTEIRNLDVTSESHLLKFFCKCWCLPCSLERWDSRFIHSVGFRHWHFAWGIVSTETHLDVCHGHFLLVSSVTKALQKGPPCLIYRIIPNGCFSNSFLESKSISYFFL